MQNVRLPPKKTRPTPRTLNATAAEQQPSLASLQPRSPLSPLHPSSPLFPDGLIAPVWLRKHRELVPSVFVSFYCLTEQIIESDSTTTEEQKGVQSNGKIAEVLSGPELKQRDEALIRAISDRKRTLSERGIKFTVVLLTTRAMLGECTPPSLQERTCLTLASTLRVTCTRVAAFVHPAVFAARFSSIAVCPHASLARRAG